MKRSTRRVAGVSGLAGLALLALALLPGCPEEQSGDDELTIVVQADTEKLKAEAARISEREKAIEVQKTEILSARKRLIDNSAERHDLSGLIEAQRKLLERETALRSKETALSEQRASLNAEALKVIQKGAPAAMGAAAPANTGARDLGIARREEKMASREAGVARREKLISEREAALARREAALAAGTGAAAGALRVSSSEPGRRVGRREVERAHKVARARMRARGILPADLPGEATNAQQEIYKRSRKGQWVQALDAVEAFRAAIEAQPIDEAFVQAKMSRLNLARPKAHLGTTKAGQVDSLLSAATGAFADGKLSLANRKLNAIFGLLGRR